MKFSLNWFKKTFILVICFTFLAHSTTMSKEEALQSLTEQWKVLRQVKGHFQDGDYDKDVDGFNGRKHLVMKEMHEILKSSSTSEIMAALGNPDQVTETLEMNHTPLMMPGPVMPSDVAAQTGPMLTSGPIYLVYYWRGNHDYLWFKIESSSGRVVDSGWYNALE